MAGKWVFNPFTVTLDWTEVPSAQDEPIVFVQASPSDQWHIVHGRGINPSIVLRRVDGQTINGFGIDYPDHNTVDLYPGLIAGEATLTF